jgi:hypothetical protein
MKEAVETISIIGDALAGIGLKYVGRYAIWFEYIPIALEGDMVHVIQTQKLISANVIHSKYIVREIAEIVDLDSYVSTATRMKIGRFIKALLPGVNQGTVESIATKIVAESAEPEFKIVYGEGIREAYLIDNYLSDSGTLGNSCMASNDKQDYLDIYCNSENVGLLVLYRRDKITGRALLWKANYYKDDGSTEKVIFMDRIYTNKTRDEEVFKKYARDNDMMFLAEQCSNAVEFEYNGITLFNPSLSVRVNGDAEQYPYLDNLYYMSKRKGFLRTIANKSSYWLLKSTEGNIQEI